MEIGGWQIIQSFSSHQSKFANCNFHFFFCFPGKCSVRYWAYVRLYALQWQYGIRLLMHLQWCLWCFQHSDYSILSWESMKFSFCFWKSFTISLSILLFAANNHSEFSVWASELHCYWHWQSFAGWWIDFVVTHGGVRTFHICTPCGIYSYSSHLTQHAYYLHTMRWRRNTSIGCQIYDIGPWTILNWAFRLCPSNATIQSPKITIFKANAIQLNVFETIYADICVCRKKW